MENTAMHPEKPLNKRNDLLKLIALITMLIDHIGVVFFPEVRLWRTIGRIAFPIFAWQIVEGTIHTSNRSKYLLRIFIFALISQIPYMFLNPDITMNPFKINILFQLFTGVLIVISAEKIKNTKTEPSLNPVHKTIVSFLWFLSIFFLIFMPDIINFWIPELSFSYGSYGQWMFLIFYLTRNSKLFQFIGYLFLSFYYAVCIQASWESESFYGFAALKAWVNYWMNPKTIITSMQPELPSMFILENLFFQTRSIFALPIIWLAQKFPSPFKLNTWIAYWFYPVHISILVTIRFFISQ